MANIPIFMAAIILFAMRRRAFIRSVNFVTGLLKMYATAFGGGNIRIRHRWDRTFFTIAFFTAFFVTSILVANICMHSIIHENPYTVDTFDKLSKQKVPVYLAISLNKHIIEATAMIR